MTWTKRTDSKERLLTDYDREMLRSAFVSLFWSVITWKKQHGGFALKTLSDKLGKNKSAPSRWFSGRRPNWTVNTIADIAATLNVDLMIEARDRATGMVFTPAGLAVKEPCVVEAFPPPLRLVREDKTSGDGNGDDGPSGFEPPKPRLMAEAQ